ncbi:MAG: AmmeMemoRadiSam system protein A [Lachnospiraceae bacterium]|nr:AmmeMemoRadiSam system protein A [Lachnospiraceae bacterium]
MSLLGGFMVPHPPMILPEVGRGSEKQIRKTIDAYRTAARGICELDPETIILTSPHSVMYSDYFHISPGASAHGDLASFGAPSVRIDADYDTEVRRLLCEETEKTGFPAGTQGERSPLLDHATIIPLTFVAQAYREAGKTPAYRLVRIGLSGLPLTEHYRLGMMIRDAVESLGRRAVFIASGDLSHKLQTYGPYGFAPEGPVYDERIMKVCGSGSFGELLAFDEDFCEKAAECGHRSFVIMAGAFDRTPVRAQALSHEDVTGVGYGICTFYPLTENGKIRHSEDRAFLDLYEKERKAEAGRKQAAEDPYVTLARCSLEYFVQNGRHISLPAALSSPAMQSALCSVPQAKENLLSRRAGAFVSLHKFGQLRGCIGTIQAVRSSLAEEIAENAVSACSEDPRFQPVQKEELPFLEYSVDVLGTPESISSPAELDVKRYGVIVTCGGRRGLLLPDLPGVDTPAQQISIARRKAGIGKNEEVRLQRFEVVRHF